MKRGSPASRQSGAVAIMTAFAILLLIAMIGLVVDLGYLYTRKTELQNAADAAALAGAKELNGSAGGITQAAAQAILLAAANGSDFGATPVAITNAEIEFGPTPDGPWSGVAVSQGTPADKNYIKVDTSLIAQGSRPTWFMGVVSAFFGSTQFANTRTFGMAVAGRSVCEGLPIFTCIRPGGVAPNYGFVPGTSYRLAPSESTPPHLGPGNIGWMDPVPPGSPGLIGGANDMREVICRGQSACLSAGTYTSLTQPAFNPMMDALNTRFGIYTGPLNDAEHKQACPADTNVKEYPFDGAIGSGAPADWLTNSPLDKQGLDGAETVIAGSPRIVHWAAVHPETGDTPAVSGGYPTTGTPYSQTGGVYWQPPPATAGGDPVASDAGRRIVTIGIANNCAGLAGSGDPVTIVAFARFLLQKQGVGSGSGKGFHGEFINITDTTPTDVPEIKLYR